MASDIKAMQSVITYSGTCTMYKKTLVQGNKMKYTPEQTAFGKVVISRSPKRFSFYFNGKLVTSSTDFLSSVDTRQGGEDFSLNGDYSAHRFTAERTFYVYYTPGMGDMGYEFEIENYKVN